MAINLDFDGARIKAIRERLGLSQQAFAQRLGVSMRALSYWETGGRTPDRRDTIQVLLEAEAEADA